MALFVGAYTCTAAQISLSQWAATFADYEDHAGAAGSQILHPATTQARNGLAILVHIHLCRALCFTYWCEGSLFSSFSRNVLPGDGLSPCGVLPVAQELVVDTAGSTICLVCASSTLPTMCCGQPVNFCVKLQLSVAGGHAIARANMIARPLQLRARSAKCKHEAPGVCSLQQAPKELVIPSAGKSCRTDDESRTVPV